MPTTAAPYPPAAAVPRRGSSGSAIKEGAGFATVHAVRDAEALAARLRRSVLEERHRAALSRTLAQQRYAARTAREVTTLSSAEASRLKEQRSMALQLANQQRRIAVLQGKVRGSQNEVSREAHGRASLVYERMRSASMWSNLCSGGDETRRGEGKESCATHGLRPTDVPADGTGVSKPLSSTQLAGAIAFNRIASGANATRLERASLDALRSEQSAALLDRNRQRVAIARSGESAQRRTDAIRKVQLANAQHRKDVLAVKERAQRAQLEEALREVNALRATLSRVGQA